MINTMTLRLKFSHFELRSSNVSFVSEAALYIFLSFPLPNKIQPHPHPPTHTYFITIIIIIIILLLLLLLLLSPFVFQLRSWV